MHSDADTVGVRRAAFSGWYERNPSDIRPWWLKLYDVRATMNMSVCQIEIAALGVRLPECLRGMGRRVGWFDALYDGAQAAEDAGSEEDTGEADGCEDDAEDKERGVALGEILWGVMGQGCGDMGSGSGHGGWIRVVKSEIGCGMRRWWLWRWQVRKSRKSRWTRGRCRRRQAMGSARRRYWEEGGGGGGGEGGGWGARGGGDG